MSVTLIKFARIPNYALSNKQADILCGLIAYPDQRLVHQIATDTQTEKAWARNSHTSVPMRNNLKACKRLAKLGLIYVKSVWGDQLEYTVSELGMLYAHSHEATTLEAHKKYAAQQKRERRK